MKKTKNISPYMLLGVGIASASFLSSKKNRHRVKDVYTKVRDKWITRADGSVDKADFDLIEKAGHPDPHDIGDNKMVDEGAMYSVEYYNEAQQQL